MLIILHPPLIICQSNIIIFIDFITLLINFTIDNIFTDNLLNVLLINSLKPIKLK